MQEEEVHEYIPKHPLNPVQSKEKKSKVAIAFWIRSNTVLHMLQQFD